jgi:beta-lactamase regulating signal transducer with metallopeptidase domain
MSATGGLVILAVLLVRLCLKKAPKRWSWALWAIVLLRLLTPFGIPVSVALPSGLPAGLPDFAQRAETVPAAAEENPLTDFSVSSAVEAENETTPIQLDPDLLQEAQGVPVPSGGQVAQQTPAASSSPSEDGGKAETGRADFLRHVWEFVPFVWLAGAMLMVGWNLAAYRLLKNRLAEAVPTGTGEVYETDRADSAFVVGLFRPKIYLPSGLSMVEQACVVAHERAHIRCGDPWWRLLSFAALTVHWFNPLVWLAFRLSGKDMEMSCDEAVLRRTPVDIRAAYSRTLVKFASRGRIEGPALAFGEGETGSRVKNVMKYKKPVLWVSVAAAAVLVLSGVALAVNIRAKDTKLLHSVYSAEKVTFCIDLSSTDESAELNDRLRETLGQLRWMLAGDGTMYITGPGFEDWHTNEVPGGGTEQWIMDGTLVSDCIRGIDSPEDVTNMIRETTGVKIGGIVDAVVSITEPYSPNHSSYDTLFSTADGKFWAASIAGRKNLEKGNASFLIELSPDNPLQTGGDTFFSKSLHKPVSKLLPEEEKPEVFIYESIRDMEDRYIILFVAGDQVNSLVTKPDNEVPFHFGVAIFLPGSDGKELRLADCQICPDVTVTRQFRDRFPSESDVMGTVQQNGNRFVFVTEDGQTIRAVLTLPERTKNFFGKTEYAGDCAIRFLPVEGESMEDALEQAREEAREELLWEQNLERIQREGAEEQRLEEEKARREEAIRQTREKIDAAYDAFLAEHYELEDLSSYLAAYATRRIDLNADGWNELVVYRMPTQSAYPLDIYEYDRLRYEVRAFHTSLEGIPASVNADPGGFYFAQIGEHDADRPDGFYGDFFRRNGETFLIAMDAGEFWQKIVCHAFSSVSNRLAAQTLFKAERYGEFVSDETKKNKAFVNGKEIPIDGYSDALFEWRTTWGQREGGNGDWICQEPLWNESEVSGWPFEWLRNRMDEVNGKTTKQQWTRPDGQPLFTLTFPAGWEDNVITEAGEWTEAPGSEEFCLQIDFYDRLERESTNLGFLGSLVLYRHSPDRFYPTGHTELQTLTLPDGESYDLVLIFPGDMQYWDYADHYNLWLTKLKNVAARVSFPREEGYRTTIAPERAKGLLHDALVRAYENIYGTFEPLFEDPTPEGAVSVEDRLYLRFVIARLMLADGRTGAYEDEDYYYFPVIFPFAVDKESGAIYKVYEGWDPAANSEYTRFTPFNWNDPDALAFAG